MKVWRTIKDLKKRLKSMITFYFPRVNSSSQNDTLGLLNALLSYISSGSSSLDFRPTQINLLFLLLDCSCPITVIITADLPQSIPWYSDRINKHLHLMDTLKVRKSNYFHQFLRYLHEMSCKDESRFFSVLKN